MSKEIRREFKIAQLEDLATINNLIRLSKAYWGYDAKFMEQYMQRFGMTTEQLQKSIIRLFYLDNKLAGFYSYLKLEDGSYELDNIFLHPDYIGKGHGRELWQAACNTAKEFGMKDFILWSDPNAEPFYLAMGCVRIGTRISPLRPDRPLPILKYKLT